MNLTELNLYYQLLSLSCHSEKQDCEWKLSQEFRFVCELVNQRVKRKIKKYRKRVVVSSLNLSDKQLLWDSQPTPLGKDGSVSPHRAISPTSAQYILTSARTMVLRDTPRYMCLHWHIFRPGTPEPHISAVSLLYSLLAVSLVIIILITSSLTFTHIKCCATGRTQDTVWATAQVDLWNPQWMFSEKWNDRPIV